MSYESTAISAQGSKLEIESGSGGAVSLTSLALGNPTIFTKNAHGLSNGDVVTFADFTGADAATLNGQTAVVKNVTTNTFAVDIDTTGKTITIGTATATPITLTEIKEIRTYSGFDGEAGEFDKSHLNSPAKEFGLGLRDYGSFNVDIAWLATDAGQVALKTSAAAGTKKSYKLTIPGPNTYTFDAYAKSVPISGGMDKSVDGSFKLRITGTVVEA